MLFEQTQISVAARELETAYARYMQSMPDEHAAAAARMVNCWDRLFRAILPGASHEIVHSLVNLCAVESARTWVTKMEAAHRGPAAQIVEIRTEDSNGN